MPEKLSITLAALYVHLMYANCIVMYNT